MMKPTLLILAAGMGSRYGGLKQIDGLGPNEEAIIDFSIYDAIEAGFGKVVFVIRESFAEAFKEKFTGKFEDKIQVEYAYQEVNTPIPGVTDLPERTKPWGTAHAVLVAADKIQEPFAVINADDFYGRSAFQQIAKFLTTEVAPDRYGMVGYILANTLSDFGHVSRGVCSLDADSCLETVVERTKIERKEGQIVYYENEQSVPLEDDTVVSMNFWGLHPNVFEEIRTRFIKFAEANKENPKSEFYIPLVANELLTEGKIKLSVMTSRDKWHGVTYKDDKDVVVGALKKLSDGGTYPQPLWS